MKSFISFCVIFSVFFFLFLSHANSQNNCGCIKPESVKVTMIYYRNPNTDQDAQEVFLGAQQAAQMLKIYNPNFRLVYPQSTSEDELLTLIRNEAALNPSAMALSFPSQNVVKTTTSVTGQIPVFSFGAGTQWIDQSDSRLHSGPNETESAQLVVTQLRKLSITDLVCLRTSSWEADQTLRYQTIQQLWGSQNGTAVLVDWNYSDSTSLSTILKNNPKTRAILVEGGSNGVLQALAQSSSLLTSSNIGVVFFGVNKNTLSQYLGSNSYSTLFLVDYQSYAASFFTVTSIYLKIFSAAQLAIKYVKTGPVIVDSQSYASQLLGDRTRTVTPTVLERWVIHSNISDPFWPRMIQSMEDAATRFPVSVNIFQTTPQNDVNVNKQNILGIEQTSETVLLTTNASPPDINPAINDVAKTKPVIIFNAGIEAMNQVNALYYVGSDESLVGPMASNVFIPLGRKYVACLNHAYGNSAVDLRCNGINTTMTQHGLNYIQVVLSSDLEAYRAGLIDALNKNPGIDALFANGADYAEVAKQVVQSNPQQYNGILVGTADVNLNVLNDIRSGNIVFAIDQQEYLQGFLPPVLGYLYKTNHTLFQTKLLNSGPFLIQNTPDLNQKICLNEGLLNNDCRCQIVFAYHS